MKTKGFILIDGVLNVFIVGVICCLCLQVFTAIRNYEDGYLNYQELSNQRYEDAYSTIGECEACEIDESY